MSSNSIGSWGYFRQGSDQMLEIMELGEKLNLAISCPIHYPAYGKNIFECMCSRAFPAFVVRGNSPEKLKEIHREV